MPAFLLVGLKFSEFPENVCKFFTYIWMRGTKEGIKSGNARKLFNIQFNSKSRLLVYSDIGIGI